MSPGSVIMTVATFTAIQPVLVVHRALLLIPVTYERFASKVVLKWSWPLYIIGAVISAIISILGFYDSLEHIDSKAGIAITKICSNTDIVCCGFLCVALAPVRFRYFIKLTEYYRKIDSVLPRFYFDVSRICAMAFVLVTPTIVLGVASFELAFNPQMALFKNIPYYAMYFIVVMFEVQYWNLVDTTKKRLELMNEFLGRPGIKHNDILKVIQIHDYVSDVVGLINQCFNIDVSIIVMSCFMRLVMHLHHVFMVVRQRQPMVMGAIEGTWAIIQIFRLLGVVEGCQLCENQDKKTNGLVYLLLASDVDDDTKQLLRQFAVKLSARKIKFSAYALSKINRSLLASMCSSVVTFLVIAIQLN